MDFFKQWKVLDKEVFPSGWEQVRSKDRVLKNVKIDVLFFLIKRLLLFACVTNAVLLENLLSLLSFKRAIDKKPFGRLV